MNYIDELLTEDSLKGAINRLCEEVADFSQVDFVHIMWAKKGEPVQGGCFGSYSDLVSSLEKAKLLLLLRSCTEDVNE